MQGFQELRPQSWDEFVGQTKVVSQLRRWAAQGVLPHLLLVGPPGSGKTTVMGLLEKEFPGLWLRGSSGDFSTKELRESLDRAREQRRQLGAEKVFLVLDEVHRLNRVQQDLLLEPLEKYEITLIAATTEIPQGVLAPAFLSRVRILKLEPFKHHEIHELLQKALQKIESGLALESLLSPEAQDLLVNRASLDLRGALRGLQQAHLDWKASPNHPLNTSALAEVLGESPSVGQGPTAAADALSALIKSMRGSDPDAALLWLAQLEALGTPSEHIARRMVILAAEDIGNAEPRALPLAQAAFEACRSIGWPEAGILLSQVAIFLACAPKSNSAYRAIQAAREVIQTQGVQTVPLLLTARGRSLYQNPHEHPQGVPSGEGLLKSYLPAGLSVRALVPRSARGFEKKMWEYLSWLRREANEPAGLSADERRPRDNELP